MADSSFPVFTDNPLISLPDVDRFSIDDALSEDSAIVPLQLTIKCLSHHDATREHGHRFGRRSVGLLYSR
jgi:hypothetical protein